MDVDLCVGLEGHQWRLTGASSSDVVALSNDYLGYLADRNYSPQTVRAYAFALLAFCRWLTARTRPRRDHYRRAASITSPPAGKPPCRDGPDRMCVRMDGRRADAYAPATINHRLAAISGLFGFRCYARPRREEPGAKGQGGKATLRWGASGPALPMSLAVLDIARLFGFESRASSRDP